MFSGRLQRWVIKVTFWWEPPMSESVNLFWTGQFPGRYPPLSCLEGICLTDCLLRSEWGKGPVYLLVCRPFMGSPCFQNSNSVLPCTNHSKKMDLSSAGLGKGIHQGSPWCFCQLAGASSPLTLVCVHQPSEAFFENLQDFLLSADLGSSFPLLGYYSSVTGPSASKSCYLLSANLTSLILFLFLSLYFFYSLYSSVVIVVGF